MNTPLLRGQAGAEFGHRRRMLQHNMVNADLFQWQLQPLAELWNFQQLVQLFTCGITGILCGYRSDFARTFIGQADV